MKNYPDQTALIRQHIERLHHRGSSDWQTLMRQVDAGAPRLALNPAQMLATFAVQARPQLRDLDLEWGRGTGKTTVFAMLMEQIVKDLPRGAFQWVVPTYAKFLTEIIPAFIHGMEMMGLYKDLHYFIGRRPPARWRWPEPYKPPVRPDNFIFFWNGFGTYMLSQDIPGSGRGLSTDGEIKDEAALLNKRKLDEESGPSVRGSNLKKLGDRRFFMFNLSASSTPLTQEGAWFVDRELDARHSAGSHLFLRANCEVNLHNLAPGYLERGRRSCADEVTYEAEYLNVRPVLQRGGFYGALNEEVHAYSNYDYGHYANQVGLQPDCRGDADCNPAAPLVLGIDWGAAINSLVVGQQAPGEYRALKEFFALGRQKETQDDMLQAFCTYYAAHPTREVWAFYDATGNAETGNVKFTRAEQAFALLASKGWRVRKMTISGTNPRHFEKYLLWEALLKENNPRLPRFRINRANCPSTWVSMTRAKKKIQPDGSVKKDKSSERSDNRNRQFATDLSDAGDQPIYGLYNQLVQGFGVIPGG